jgi:hypothetical protein
VSSSPDQAVSVDQSLVKRGFRPVQRQGQLLYCRSHILTGTHFSNTVCLTQAQIAANDENTKANLDTLSRAGKAACPTSSCN